MKPTLGGSLLSKTTPMSGFRVEGFNGPLTDGSQKTKKNSSFEKKPQFLKKS